jgi:hypothetical protein
MNKQQLTDLVIIPTLDEIPNGYSGEAVMAIQMIIAHESEGGEYIRQKDCCGDVGAFGATQIEKLTHNQTWKFGDSIWKNALNLKIISKTDFFLRKHPPVERLIYDLRYAVFMTRQKLFMAQGALPLNAKDMSVYLKKHWNGDGKATPEKYHNDFLRWV